MKSFIRRLAGVLPAGAVLSWATLFIIALAVGASAYAQSMVPGFICRNTQNGYRQMCIVLHPENSTIHYFDDPSVHGRVSAQFRSNNTVFWVIRANYGVANGSISFLLDVRNGALYTHEGVSTIFGKADPSSMQWSCTRTEFGYPFSGR